MEIDFETYSEAGFIWDEKSQKYKAPPNATKKGLPTIGAAVYSEHPSTEVLSCAYDLGDGQKWLWIPGMPPPFELFHYVERGGLIEAWNVKFERWIWLNVCIKKYGWPTVQEWQWRDAAAKAVAHALPKSLDPCGTVLNIHNKKDKDGWRLLTKFSMPRNPTKGNPNRRILPEDDLEDAKNLYRYNIRDIEAELEISALIPDLIPSELEFWQCDLAINARGIRIDVPAIKAAISVVEQAHRKYNTRLQQLTNNTVTKASELAKIRVWLESQGVSVPVLDAEKVNELLKTDYLTAPVREVLEIRELLSSAAVKKLYAMINMVTKSERLHDLFIYHSARTGRAAGAGVQPQNFPNSGPSIKSCICGFYSAQAFSSCVRCNNPFGLTPSEWNAEAVNQAIETILTASLECVEYYHGNAIATVSGCLRGMFIPDSGKDFICSDYSAIEAVVLAALAGEEWRMEVFRTHGKIYEMSASKITGIPFEEYINHKLTTGQHHPTRKTVGKVAELACFTHDTQVLTNRGYVAIMDVRKNDLLWDGIEWVKHQGVIHKGKKKVIKLDGVKMTPEHPISINGFWMEANELVSSKNILTQALANGSENLPTLEKMSFDQRRAIDWHDVNAHAVNLLHRLIVICGLDVQKDVMCVLKGLQNQPRLSGLKHTKNTDILYRIVSIDEDLEIVCHLLSAAVTMLKIPPTLIMEGEELQYKNPGEITKPNFFRILLQFPAGIMSFLKWIELIVIEVTRPEIFDSFQGQITNLINEKYRNYNKESSNLRNVYDIVNAGDRHRFTIKTNSGHLLVHNSGYGGWIGAWKAFGADAFFSEDEIKKAVLAWRAASPAIVEFWGGQVRGCFPDFYGLEGAAVQAIMSPGEVFDCRGFQWQMREDILYCKLLSGRNLTYHKPLLRPSERKNGTYSISFEGWNSNPKYGAPGWVRMDTYSGKLTENCIAENTQVLTDSGWKSIQDVRPTDLVHDGVEFVSHSGIISKNKQTCIQVDGVWMTPDHKVLNKNNEWKAAWETKRPYRPKIRDVNGFAPSRSTAPYPPEKVVLVVYMRLREFFREMWLGCYQRPQNGTRPKLRLQKQRIPIQKNDYTRNESSPRFCGMALNARPMPVANASSVGELRRTRDNSVPILARVLSKLLGRYEGRISARSTIRPDRQQPRIFQRKLPMGSCENKFQQQTVKRDNKYTPRENDYLASFRSFWDKCNDNLLSIIEKMAGRKTIHNTKFSKQRVYDIVNCGDRHRFVVKGETGLLIVHNCVQAVARDILAHAIVNLERAGYPVVLHVHDEIVSEVPEGFGTIEEFERIMSTMPDWATGWPLKASGGWRAKRYGK